MLRIKGKVLAAGVVLGLGVMMAAASSGMPVTAQTVKQSGVTISPAAIKLELPAGEVQASADFSVANHYAAPVTLIFSIEADPAFSADHTQAAAAQVFLAATEMTLQSGQSATQTAVLLDSEDLSPGGQQLTLVVRQAGQAAGAVGVNASIRLPVTIIKQSGAITKLSLGSLLTPGLTLSMPESISATLRNTGNMIAIPHGNVTVTGPGGKLFSEGTVNVASKAVTPGNDITFTTPITQLDTAMLPGIYRVNFSYGLGGDYPPQVVSVAFFYIAWWHFVLLLVLGMAVYFALRWFRQRQTHLKKKRSLFKRPLLAERGGG
jgi:hypothetical protein